jgi:hypothetical protein
MKSILTSKHKAATYPMLIIRILTGSTFLECQTEA